MTLSAILNRNENTTKVPESVETEIMTVTPAMAADWIENRNPHNRRVRERYVRELASKMQNGSWNFNGDSIKFDVEGNLLDGQHRLWASIESDLPFKVLVISGLPSETQDTMDVGKKRTVGDVLELASIKNPRKIASVASLCMKYERRELVSSPAPYPPDMIKHWVLDNDTELQAAYHYVQGCRPPHGVGLSQVALAFLLFEGAKAGFEAQAKEFIYQYSTRIGITEGSGVHRLVRFVDINNRVNAKPRASIYQAIMVICFNQFLDNRVASRSFSPASIQEKLNREGFPLLGTK